jgi:vacuolar-type H+-ATPase subunit C/Vma6
MPISEIALVARARGLAQHHLTRAQLDDLATADDLRSFARRLMSLGGAIDPIGEPLDVFAIERAIRHTAQRHMRTLYRWQERTPGVLDVFAAYEDRRSLRALVRGAAQGAPVHRRLEGLIATPSLPQLALSELARQSSAVDIARQLVLLGHPDGSRLLPLVRSTQMDLLAVDHSLLAGFADRANRIAAPLGETVRDFVAMSIDAGNVQNAIAIAGEARDTSAADLFVYGGRWLSRDAFAGATGRTQDQVLTAFAAALADSPLASMLPVVSSDIGSLDRTFLAVTLDRVTRIARLDPLRYAPLLRVLLLFEAQSRDVRTLAWGAALGTPPMLRRQQLVTPA